MSLSSSSSSSNLLTLKQEFKECLSDIAEILATMDGHVETLELETSSDADSTVDALLDLLSKLEEFVDNLDGMRRLPPDYEDLPECEDLPDVELSQDPEC